jgi:hypothetical protein
MTYIINNKCTNHKESVRCSIFLKTMSNATINFIQSAWSSDKIRIKNPRMSNSDIDPLSIFTNVRCTSYTK